MEPLQVMTQVPTEIFAFLKIWHPCLPEPGIELTTTENTQIRGQGFYQVHHQGIGSGAYSEELMQLLPQEVAYLLGTSTAFS